MKKNESVIYMEEVFLTNCNTLMADMPIAKLICLLKT